MNNLLKELKGAPIMSIKLDARYDLYINGKWVPASDGRVFTTTNPATGEKLAECAEATREE